MSVNDSINLVFCTLKDVTVALPATHVRGLDAEPGDLPSRDLADVLGAPIEGPRRRLRVLGNPEFDLLVGGAISVGEVPATDVQALPALVAGLRTGGLQGVLAMDGSFALVFDPRDLAPETPHE